MKGVKVDMTDVFIGNTSVDLGYFPKIKAWKFTSPQGTPNTRDPIILKDIDGNYYHTNHYFYFEPGIKKYNQYINEKIIHLNVLKKRHHLVL